MHFKNNEINSIAASGVLEALSAAWRRAFDIEWIERVKTVARQSSEVASTQKTNLLRHWVLQEVGIERCNDQSIQIANFGRDGSGELIAVELQECKLGHLLYVWADLSAEIVVVHVKLEQIGQIVHVGGDGTGEGIEIHIELEKVAQVAQFGWDRTASSSLFHVQESKLG